MKKIIMALFLLALMASGASARKNVRFKVERSVEPSVSVAIEADPSVPLLSEEEENDDQQTIVNSLELRRQKQADAAQKKLLLNQPQLTVEPAETVAEEETDEPAADAAETPEDTDDAADDTPELALFDGGYFTVELPIDWELDKVLTDRGTQTTLLCAPNGTAALIVTKIPVRPGLTLPIAAEQMAQIYGGAAHKMEGERDVYEFMARPNRVPTYAQVFVVDANYYGSVTISGTIEGADVPQDITTDKEVVNIFNSVEFK